MQWTMLVSYSTVSISICELIQCCLTFCHTLIEGAIQNFPETLSSRQKVVCFQCCRKCCQGNLGWGTGRQISSVTNGDSRCKVQNVLIYKFCELPAGSVEPCSERWAWKDKSEDVFGRARLSFDHQKAVGRQIDRRDRTWVFWDPVMEKGWDILGLLSHQRFEVQHSSTIQKESCKRRCCFQEGLLLWLCHLYTASTLLLVRQDLPRCSLSRSQLSIQAAWKPCLHSSFRTPRSLPASQKFLSEWAATSPQKSRWAKPSHKYTSVVLQAEPQDWKQLLYFLPFCDSSGSKQMGQRLWLNSSFSNSFWIRSKSSLIPCVRIFHQHQFVASASFAKG